MRYEAILFDLDGTLTASGEGITKSVQYALKKMGREDQGKDLKKLEVFVGPPLLEQFMRFCGISQEEAQKAVGYYRERYNVTGVYENRPYQGIRELLEGLKKKGYRLAVASSKPDQMVHVVTDHFALTPYFEVILGSDIQRPKMTKAEVIQQVLERMDLTEKKEQVLMVGDRYHDVEGAAKIGISCLGVTYGYGSARELSEAGAIGIIDHPQELEKILDAMEKEEREGEPGAVGELLSKGEIPLLDIGKGLFSTPVYPGDPEPRKEPFFQIEKGDDCNLTVLTMGSHNGTHLDAPKHFCQGRGSVDRIPLEKCMGICKVVSLTGEITAPVMEMLLKDGTKKILIKGQILLTPEAAEVMADREIDLVGVESQTVGAGEGQKQVHKILLGKDVVILEGLVLEKILPGPYFLAAQPLKMEGLDGSPVRPVLIPLS